MGGPWPEYGKTLYHFLDRDWLLTVLYCIYPKYFAGIDFQSLKHFSIFLYFLVNRIN